MKQPRKAQLRRQIERLTRRLDAERTRADHAETLRAFDHQLVDSEQAKLRQLEAWVRDIVDILNLHSPASALLPWELRTRTVPANTNHIVTGSLPECRIWETPNVVEPLAPVTLVHLKMFLEDHPEVWRRLIEVQVQDRTGDRHSVVRYAVSREQLSVLLSDRRRFVEHILEHMGRALFENLNKTK